jgi:hypothetical protein
VASSAAAKSPETRKPVVAASSPTATYNSKSNDESEDNNPWDREGWVPRTESGEQKSPNMVSGMMEGGEDIYS